MGVNLNAVIVGWVRDAVNYRITLSVGVTLQESGFDRLKILIHQ